MSQLKNKPVRNEPGAPLGPGDAPHGPSARRVFIVGSIVIVAFVAVLLGGIRMFLFPIWEANSEAVRQVATAQAQISAASTQEALTPVAAPTVLTAAPALPTTASAPAPTLVPIAGAQATAAPTRLAATATPGTVPSATPAVLATVPPEQAAQIAAAYKRYFEARGEALLNLDPTPLDDVAAGQALGSLKSDIEQDRAQGRALKTNVRHNAVVVDVQGDDADVADRYNDSSIYVDPITQEPLPGEVAPESPDVAPVVSVVYHLRRIDGIWKVVSGQRFVPQGNQ